MFSAVTARKNLLSRAPALALGLLIAAAASANPQGPVVVHGAANFANPNAATLQITNTPGTIINWHAFSIGAQETTRFVQQSAASAVLNRVTGPEISSLMGQLQSNGRVFLLNANGIIIGRDAIVDTAGLVMSTLDMTDEDFLAGRLRFEGDENSGEITNHGYLKTAPGGELILVAPRIANVPEDGNDNSGVIDASGGKLILAAGRSITITSLDDPDITFEVQAPDDEVVNLGTLLANGGVAGVMAGTVRHSGEISADTLSVDAQGRVVISASARVETSAGSTIHADGGDALPGGTLSITAFGPEDETASVQLAGAVSADGVTGGKVTITGNEVALAGAMVTANGANGGGEALVGGDFQGGGDVPAATNLTVDGGSRVEASATGDGDGGKAIVWADRYTDFRGLAAARGGVNGGDGGLVEVSGREGMNFAGGIDVGAPKGSAGTMLLDPDGISVIPGAGEDEVALETPSAGGRFGSSLQFLPNGNIIMINQDADVGGLLDAGQIVLLDPAGVVLNAIDGSAANERLGAYYYEDVADGNLVFRSPDATVGSLTSAGTVLLVNDDTGALIGRSNGISADERFGLNIDLYSRAPPGTYIVRSPDADVGGVVDAGRVVLISETTGRAIGSTAGTHAGDRLGSIRGDLRASGNLVYRVPGADPGGITDAGSVFLVSGTTGARIGRIDGNSANERLGNQVDLFTFGNADFLIRSQFHDAGGLADAGAVILAADVDLGGGDFERGRVVGTSAGERLGDQSVIVRSSGNYVLRSPLWDTPGGVSDAGSIILASRADGTEIGRADGDSANERFGDFAIWSISGSSDFLVYDSQHAGGAGTVEQIADTDLGGGNIVRGSIVGGTAGDFAGVESGNRPVDLGNGRYYVKAPNYDGNGVTNSGAFFVVDAADATVALELFGDTVAEGLGLNAPQFLSGTAQGYALRSPAHGGDAGAIFFLDFDDFDAPTTILQGTLTGSLDTSGVTGAQDDRLGDLTLQNVAGGYVVRVPYANAGAGAGEIADAGSVLLVDETGTVLGQVDGDSEFERLGQQLVDPLSNGDYVIFSRDADVDLGLGLLVDAGAAVLVDGATGDEIGRVTGTSASERLGEFSNGYLRQLSSGNYVLFSRYADPGGISNAGSVILASGADGTELGRVDGQSLDELFGQDTTLYERGNGNYVLRSPSWDTPGGVQDAGSVIVASGADGNEIGRVNGDTASERFGSNIATFYSQLGDDFLVFSPQHGGGAGIVAQVAGDALPGPGGNILRGSVTGAVAGDNVGNNSFAQFLGSGNYLLGASGVTVNGLDNAGSVFIVDPADASLVGRVDGASANEFFGDYSPRERANGNLVFQSPFADPGGVSDAGSLLLTQADGTLIGRLDGNNQNERFSETIDFFWNGDDMLVRSRLHNNGNLTAAGGYFVVASEDLDPGPAANILRWSLLGSSADEQLGNYSIQRPFGTGDSRAFVQSPNADANGLTDAGALIFFDWTTGAELGRTFGESASEFFGQSYPIQTDSGNFWVPSSNADTATLSDAGAMVLINGTTGVEIDRTYGVSAGERFGSSFESLFYTGGDNILINSTSADIGGLTDAGSLVLLSGTTGQIVGRTDGVSANESFGSSRQWIYDSSTARYTGVLVRSSNADIGGLVDAGSVVMVSGATGKALGRTNGVSANERFGSYSATQVYDSASGTYNYLFRSPDADIGGLTDAGAVVMVGGTDGKALGRTNGTSANERLGLYSPYPIYDSSSGSNNYHFRSPDADVGGLTDAGSWLLVSGQDGTLIGRADGTSAGERFSANTSYFSASSTSRIFRSPLADAGGLADVGALVQVDTTTGLVRQRVFGISVNERLSDSAYPSLRLADGRYLFGSPDADVNGKVDAGRLVFFDPTAITSETVAFQDEPFTDLVLTNQKIQNFLASGATVILQANSDFLLDAGTSIAATAGALTIQAGRNIDIGGTISVPTLTLSAQDPGADTGISGGGPGDIIVRDGGSLNLASGKFSADTLHIDLGSISASGSVQVDAQSMRIFGGSSMSIGSGTLTVADLSLNAGSPASLLSTTSLTIEADTISLTGASGAGAYATIASLGELTINAKTIDLASGVADGTVSSGLFADEVFAAFNAGDPLPPNAFIYAGTALNVTAESIRIAGGEGADTFAAFVSLGEFNVDTGSLEFLPGSGVNADAAFLALGGVAQISFLSCDGCDELFSDPLASALAESGIYIAGLLREPTVNAILANLDSSASEGAEETGESEDDEDELADAGEAEAEADQEGTTQECN